MEFINVIADESKLEFEGLASYISDTKLWQSMYNQCLQANKEIEKNRFSLAKSKRKLSNVLKLVTVFNAMVFDMPGKQSQSVTEIAQTQENLHIEQLMIEKDALEHKMNALLESVKEKESCIAFLTQKEIEQENVISLLKTQLLQAQSSAHAQCLAYEHVTKSEARDNDADSGVDTVESFEEVNVSSDNESVKSVDSINSNIQQKCKFSSPYTQRKVYAKKTTLKCLVCKREGHIARFCVMANNNDIQKRLYYPKTMPRRYEVYSVRWCSNLRYRGHNNQTNFPFKTQMQRLQTANSPLRQERYHYVSYNTVKNNVSSP